MKKMKKFRIFVMMLFVSLCFANKLNAQITLEQTFEGMVETIYGGGYYSADFSEDFCIITIYNYDCSLYKQLTIYPYEGCESVSYVFVMSPELIYIRHKKIEFGEYGEYCHMLYDYNGNIIKNWDPNVSVFNFNMDGTENYLVFLCYDDENKTYFTEVYSIDGGESVKIRC